LYSGVTEVLVGEFLGGTESAGVTAAAASGFGSATTIPGRLGSAIGGAATATFSENANSSLPNASGGALGGILGGVAGEFFGTKSETFFGKPRFNLALAGLKGGAAGLAGGFAQDGLTLALKQFECEECEK